MLSGLLLATGLVLALAAYGAHRSGRLGKRDLFGLLALGVLLALVASIVDPRLHRLAAAPGVVLVYLLFAWWFGGGLDKLPGARRLRMRYTVELPKAPYTVDLVKTPRP